VVVGIHVVVGTMRLEVQSLRVEVGVVQNREVGVVQNREVVARLCEDAEEVIMHAHEALARVVAERAKIHRHLL